MDWAQHGDSVERTLSLDYSLGEVATRLDDLVRPRTPVHVLAVGVRDGAFDKLPTGRRGPVHFDILASDANALLYAATSYDPDDAKYPRVTFRVDRTRTPRVALLVSVAPNAAWKSIVERFVRAAYPRLFPVFLRQRDLRAAFENFQATFPTTEKLMLTKASQLRRLTASVSRRRFSTERTWTDVLFAEAFNDAHEQQVFFRRAHFEVCRMKDGTPHAIGVEGSVAVQAYLTVTGRSAHFFASAVEAALAAVRAETELAHDRARKPGEARARTLVAHLDEAVTLKRLPRVADVLRRMPQAAVSIVHGNPYLHARVVDFHDGSAFDVILVAPTELVIVPQLRATEGAVTRLCQYVYEHVGEAEFKDGSLQES